MLQHTFPQIHGALILLGDQPLMTTAILDTLITASLQIEKPIVAPLYHGKRGNPVLFATSLFHLPPASFMNWRKSPAMREGAA
jgi:CTP:molybdopterin cytidylyltransferase MocA